MNAQATQPQKPKPQVMGVSRTELILVCLGVVAVIFIFGLGARQKINQVATVAVPIAGEWISSEKPLRLVFQVDKSVLLTSTSPAQLHPDDLSGAGTVGADTAATVTGAYSVQPGGKVNIKLNNGARYNIEWKASSPNRIDVIDATNEGVTTFDRATPK
jgi:hypothetical protein